MSFENAFRQETSGLITAKSDYVFLNAERLQQLQKNNVLNPQELACSVANEVLTWSDTYPEYEMVDQMPDTEFVRAFLGIPERFETIVDPGAYPNIPMPPRFVLAVAEYINTKLLTRVHDWGGGDRFPSLTGSLCPKTLVSGFDFDPNSVFLTQETLDRMNISNVEVFSADFFEEEIPPADLHIVHTPVHEKAQQLKLVQKLSLLPKKTLVLTLSEISRIIAKEPLLFQRKDVEKDDIFLHSQFYRQGDKGLNYKLCLFERI